MGVCTKFHGNPFNSWAILGVDVTDVAIRPAWLKTEIIKVIRLFCKTTSYLLFQIWRRTLVLLYRGCRVSFQFTCVCPTGVTPTSASNKSTNRLPSSPSCRTASDTRTKVGSSEYSRSKYKKLLLSPSAKRNWTYSSFWLIIIGNLLLLCVIKQLPVNRFISC